MSYWLSKKDLNIGETTLWVVFSLGNDTVILHRLENIASCTNYLDSVKMEVAKIDDKVSGIFLWSCVRLLIFLLWKLDIIYSPCVFFFANIIWESATPRTLQPNRNGWKYSEVTYVTHLISWLEKPTTIHKIALMEGHLTSRSAACTKF